MFNPFRYWADRHRFTNFQARRRQILRLAAALDRLPYAPATQIDCCQMEYAYQWTDSHLASYPLFNDDPAWRARDFVLVSCANNTTDADVGKGIGKGIGKGNGGSDGGIGGGSDGGSDRDRDRDRESGTAGTAGSCANAENGGSFRGSALVTLDLIAVKGGGVNSASQIRYSVDGSYPSIPYTKPLVVLGTTRIRAVKMGVTAQSRDVTFTRLD